MVKSFKIDILTWLKTKVYVKNEIDTKLQNKSDSNHTHTTATVSVNGFLSKEDKSKLDGIATKANKTIVDSSLSSSSTNPVQNKVVNSALNGKANSSHSHSISNITNLQSALDGKSDNGHSHSISDVTNLQSKLDTIPSLTNTNILVANTNNTGTINFYKFGKIVIMELNLSKVLLTSTWNILGTVPSGYMPTIADGAGSPNIYWSIQAQQGQSAQLNIKNTGEIRLAYGNGQSSAIVTSVTYISK